MTKTVLVELNVNALFNLNPFSTLLVAKDLCLGEILCRISRYLEKVIFNAKYLYFDLFSATHTVIVTILLLTLSNW